MMADHERTAPDLSRLEGISCASFEKDGRKDRLSLQVATHFESIAGLQPGWDHAVEKLGGPVYMTFDWVKTWWQFYGKGKQLRLFLFRHGEELVALVPLYLETFGFGPAKTTVARLVGANIPPKTFDPPVDSTHASVVFSRLFNHLFSKEKCDLLSFGPVSKIWRASEAFRDASALLSKTGHKVDYQPRDVRTVFRLPPTFEQYLASFDAGERKSRLKRVRQLEKNTEITEEIIADADAIQEAFKHFVELHSEQWERIGKGGHFGAWPDALAYNSTLVVELGKKGRVKFFRLLADGKVISSRYTFLLGDTLYSELPARATGAPWDKLGIGVTSLIKFTGQTIGAGIAVVDSGLGTYEHKSGVGGEEIEVGLWRITGGSSSNRLKSRLALFVSRVVLTVFHKVWYRRIVPRLPQGVGRTQSLVWLRFDF